MLSRRLVGSHIFITCTENVEECGDTKQVSITSATAALPTRTKMIEKDKNDT
jgi:hypothetical protein